MNVVNCTTRLPKTAGSYQVIVKIVGTAHSHEGRATGVTWNGTTWEGAEPNTVVSWVDPVAEVIAVVVPKVAGPVEDPLNLSVILTGSQAATRIGVIKLIRELNALSLGDAKTFVDSAPKVVKSDLSVSDAAALKAKIEAAGGTVEIKAV
jgi:large subunit ribosomal protein L7/L12